MISDDQDNNARDLEWPECYNARDLGGIKNKNGALTECKRFIRADVLTRLTLTGKRMLIDYGVTTVIDLRFPDELDKLPGVAFADVSADGYPTCRNIPFGKEDPSIIEKAEQAGNFAAYYGIWLESFPDAVAAVMRAFIAATSGGVVYHCHSGKDRTGIVTALLLSLAGVPRQSIVNDYVKTNTRLRPLYEANLMKQGGTHATADRMESMLDCLEVMGGIKEYLRMTGLQQNDIDALRCRLVRS